MYAVRAILVACLLVVCFLAPGSSLAQLEAYAVTHPFSLPGSTTTRLQAMGGPVTCLPDDGWANPAFAGLAEDFTSMLRQSTTSFDGGLSLRVSQVSVGGPLFKRGGFQVTGLKCDSETGAGPALPGSPLWSVNEWTVGLHYGHRLSDRLAVGVGISPVFHNNVSVTPPVPGAPPLLQTRAKSDQGFRLGATYALSPKARLGAVYDDYEEDVDAVGSMVPGGALSLSTKSEAMMLGLSFRFSDDLLGAVEWFQMSTDIGPATYGDSGWRAGLEKLFADGLSLRIGSNDGSFSTGVGYDVGDWSLRYAYLNNWNYDFIGPIWGGSETHQFELTRQW